MDNERQNRTYSLDQLTIERINRIRKFRKAQGPRFAPRFSTKSYIIGDAIKLLYDYEVQQESIIHPKDQIRSRKNA